MVRIGIVGAGIRGSLFARALSQHADVEVAAICDRNGALARSVADRYGIAAFESHTEMYGQNLGAVVVATPDFTHREPVIDAAAAGLHIMVEKPLAMTVEDAEAMSDAVAAAGVRAMVGFENRWNPRFVAAKDLISSGQLGHIVGQILHLNDTRFVPTEMLAWSAKSSPVWFLMPHTLDLVLWLTGKTPASVHARGVREVLVTEGIDTWDSVDASFQFTDGTAATLHSSWVLPVSYPAVYDLRCEFVGTQSALRIEGADQGLSLMAGKLSWPQWGVQERGDRVFGFPVDMAHDFADHVLGRIPSVPTIADGLTVTTTLAAVDESLRTGLPVTLRSPDAKDGS